jgi:hypothetical protein
MRRFIKTLYPWLYQYLPEQITEYPKASDSATKTALAPRTAPKWIPPPTEIAKINVDAAVSRNED